MFERSRCRQVKRFIQFLHQLPCVERVQEVDVTGPAVDDFKRKRAILQRKNCRLLLMGVAPVFEVEPVLVMSGKIHPCLRKWLLGRALRKEYSRTGKVSSKALKTDQHFLKENRGRLNSGET